MGDDFTVTFWGVRGSHPSPGQSTLYFGGNTTCLEITIEETTIIIDAGTGIIHLGQKLASEFFKKKNSNLELTVFFTHLHHDHTQGLPFFVPLYLGQSVIHFFGPQNFGDELNTVLERSMKPPNFPIDFYSVQSVKNITTLKENNLVMLESHMQTPRIINKFKENQKTSDSSILIKVMNDFSHPANGVLVYRVEYKNRSVVFCTDVEGYVYGNAKLIHFAEETNLLVHDAQYSIEQYTGLPTPKQGYGHSTPEMAIEVANKAKVKYLALTHHDPSATDAQLKENQSKFSASFENLFYAREGLTFVIE
jgi:phosphoribosyl 1,2-cyclic phosphodiesterase